MNELNLMGQRAKEAARFLRTVTSEEKKKALEAIAKALMDHSDRILQANGKDLSAACRAGMPESMQDRLALSRERIREMAEGVLSVAKWPDPVGHVLEDYNLDNGLNVRKVSVPLGVIGIIFEARPNVCSDCAALCIRAGNACILRGGKEAFHSNVTLAEVMREALEDTPIPVDTIQLVKDTDRKSATEMMELTDYLDVLIPRGGAGLIRSVVDNAKVPVIETGAGNCHIYIDEKADIRMAADIVFNAKTSRPSVCNAAEKVLIHRNIAEQALPHIAQRLKAENVELRGDLASRSILPEMNAATEEDWSTEYIDLILGIKIVNSIEEAVAHIERYSTHHSDCIVTECQATADRFLREVDSAAVYHNASTRFTDGGQMGLGAEIGISTQKLHARGPMGVNQLVTYKYVISGKGQIR